VKRGKFTETESQAFYKEADLTGHLINDKDNSKATKPTKPAKGSDKSVPPETPSTQDSHSPANEDTTKAAWERDFQLREALNLIKGLKILSKKPAEQPS